MNPKGLVNDIMAIGTEAYDAGLIDGARAVREYVQPRLASVPSDNQFRCAVLRLLEEAENRIRQLLSEAKL